MAETKHAYSVCYSSMRNDLSHACTKLPLNAFFSVWQNQMILFSLHSLLLHWSSFFSLFTLVRCFLESV